MLHPKNNMAFNMPTNLTFFNDQLSAFEMWLEFGTAQSPPPPMLPVVLQVLLSKTHRVRVLTLLKRFLALGVEAVRLSLILGIFPYVLKLLKNPSDDIKHLVISVWASIIGFDPSCRQELVRDKVMVAFMQGLNTGNIPPSQRCLSAFVLAEVCNRYKEGQQACLQLGLHRYCTTILPNQDVMSCNTLKLWTCLTLFKLSEDFMWAKYLCITEAGHTRLYPLLLDRDPTVRAAAILALGELFGASSLTNTLQPPLTPLTPGSHVRQRSSLGSGSEESHRNSMAEDIDLKEAELLLAMQILDSCTDGSVIVRLEAVSALSKFFIQPAHISCIKLVAKLVYLRNTDRKSSSKPDRRSASPASDNGSIGRAGNQCPWHLTVLETDIMIQQVATYIKTNSEGLDSADAPPVATLSLPSEAGLATPGGSADSTVNRGSLNHQLIEVMARTYVRLWLALTEVSGKDSHSLVSQAAADICFRIHALVAIDEKHAMNTTPDMFNTAKMNKTPSGNDIGPGLYWAGGSMSNSSLNLTDAANAAGTMLHPPLSPMGASTTPIRNRSFKFNGGSSLPRGMASSSSLNESGFHPESLTRENSAAAIAAANRGLVTPTTRYAISGTNILAPPRPPSSATNSSGGGSNSKYHFVEAFRDFLHLPEEDLMMHFSTNLYEMARKEFLEYGLEFDPHVDVLSQESRDRAYRFSRLQDILNSAKYYRELFQQDVEQDRVPTNDMVYDRKMQKFQNGGSTQNLDDLMRAKSPPALVTMPSNVVKFEQDNTIKLGAQMATSQLMFHAFQDVLVVASGSTASVWSLQTKNRILEVRNKHSSRGMAVEGISSAVLQSHKIPAKPGQDSYGGSNLSSGHFNNSNNNNAARITSMTWINESYDAMLLLGSDDGVVRIWRDVSNSDTISAHNQQYFNQQMQASGQMQTGGPGGVTNGSGHNIAPSASPNLQNPNGNIELVTSFAAMPDIAETSRGSGVVFSWQQSAGTLVVGGNSSTIRVWDLGREQNVRVFNTGVETCLTAMTTNTVSNRYSSSALGLGYPSSSSNMWQADVDSTPVTWTFAGFADGSIAVFDERVGSNDGRVHFSHTSSGWVNYTHLRADVPEVIIGSVRGSVKFWDLRTMRTHKTLEVQKSPITSMAVHNCAPIMATGSHAQFIKILTLGGEQLGNIIKYYDGFLGERIGPISSLAFHPYKLVMAASSTTGLISLYHTTDNKAT